ncbi:hypothetical protein FS842_003659, partial [Serendipita sp. 407]
PYAQEPEQLPIQHFTYSDSTWPSFGVQGLGTVDAHQGNMRIGFSPNLGGDPCPFERSSMYLSPFVRWQVEEPSISTLSWSNPPVSLDRSGGLTTTSPVLSNVTSVHSSPSTAGLGAKQLPFDWSMSEVMTNREAVYQGRTRLMVRHDSSNVMRHVRSQQVRECPTKRGDDPPSSTLFDISQ